MNNQVSSDNMQMIIIDNNLIDFQNKVNQVTLLSLMDVITVKKASRQQ